MIHPVILYCQKNPDVRSSVIHPNLIQKGDIFKFHKEQETNAPIFTSEDWYIALDHAEVLQGGCVDVKYVRIEILDERKTMRFGKKYVNVRR